MNEVSQINSIEKPTILDQKELKKIVSGWQKLIVVSFFWALILSADMNA